MTAPGGGARHAAIRLAGDAADNYRACSPTDQLRCLIAAISASTRSAQAVAATLRDHLLRNTSGTWYLRGSVRSVGQIELTAVSAARKVGRCYCFLGTLAPTACPDGCVLQGVRSGLELVTWRSL